MLHNLANIEIFNYKDLSTFPETVPLTFFGHCRTVSAILPALNMPEPPSGVWVLLGVGALGKLSEDLVVCRGVHEPDVEGESG